MSTRSRRWHQALAYALLGERRPELGEQDLPDLDALIDDLSRAYGSRGALVTAVEAAQRSRSAWPVPVPGDLTDDLGPAQFWAAVNLLRERLTPRPTTAPARSRALTAEERRLLADAPPHHVG